MLSRPFFSIYSPPHDMRSNYFVGKIFVILRLITKFTKTLCYEIWSYTVFTLKCSWCSLYLLRVFTVLISCYLQGGVSTLPAEVPWEGLQPEPLPLPPTGDTGPYMECEFVCVMVYNTCTHGNNTGTRHVFSFSLPLHPSPPLLHLLFPLFTPSSFPSFPLRP